MAITVGVNAREVGRVTYFYHEYFEMGKGTTTEGPTDKYEDKNFASAFYMYRLNQSQTVAPWTGGTYIVTKRETYIYKEMAIIKPSLSGVLTGFNGYFRFTAEGAGRIAILKGPANGYTANTITSLPVAMTFTAGTHTYNFKDSEEATNAINYGIVAYQTDSITTSTYRKLNDMYYYVTYTDMGALPSARAVSPVSTSILAETDNVFRWEYSHPTNIPQSGYTVYITHNGVETEIASGTGTDTSCVIPADTLSIGAQQWYVRVTAEAEGYTLVGRSEPAYVIVRTNPSTSDVATDNMPRLTVTWTASSQQAAQVHIGDITYPTLYTDQGSFTAPEILDDGVYPVSVRTQTEDGEWSEWSEVIYADISNEPPSGAVAPQLSCQVDGATVGLEWTAVSGASQYVLYRNGVPIYAGDRLLYDDVQACGMLEYKVRALYPNGLYIESGVQTIVYLPTADTLIYDIDGLRRSLTVRHHPQYPVREWDESAGIELKEYAGRTLPVAVSDGHISRSLTLTAAYRSPQEAAALLAMLGKTVIYKSKKGECCRGVVVSASRASSLTDAVTYRISATDDDERAWLT